MNGFTSPSSNLTEKNYAAILRSYIGVVSKYDGLLYPFFESK